MHDFDKYAGRWDEAEADAFDASLREQRTVDPADWRSALDEEDPMREGR